jgi:transcriptional regulator with XRE-family HTH domain
MTEVAHPIDLNLPEKLRDREYRQKFFLAESSAQIAAQLVALRKRRGLNQQEVAELIGTRQPAISRIEKADYQSWSFSILRKIAGVLDARIRVLIEASEDIFGEYESAQEGADTEEVSKLEAAPGVPATPVMLFHNLPRYSTPAHRNLYTTNFDRFLTLAQSQIVPEFQDEHLRVIAEKDAELAQKDEKIRQLQLALMGQVSLGNRSIQPPTVPKTVPFYSGRQRQPEIRTI